MKLLATLGDFADEGIGRIVQVDLASERAEVVLAWCPPPALRIAGKGFTGLTWLGEAGRSELAVCAHSCICRVDVTRWTVTGVLHQPCMNDLHHVVRDGDRVLVSNTGADRVDAFDLHGSWIGGWDLAPLWVSSARFEGRVPSRDAWRAALRPGWSGVSARLDHDSAADVGSDARDVPFHARKLRDFVHPNHVALVEGRPLVTRFQDRAVQDLTSWRMVIPETPGHPHDGMVHDGCFWLTCTRGLVVAYAIEGGHVTAREITRIDVFDRSGRTGWCRGLVVTDAMIVVGLTAIERMPRYRWCDRPFDQTETSIVALDRRTGAMMARVDLRAFGRSPKLFDLTVLP